MVIVWDSVDETTYDGRLGIPRLMTISIRATFEQGAAPGQGPGGTPFDTIEAAFATIRYAVNDAAGQRNAGDEFQVDIAPGRAIVVPASWIEVSVSNPTNDPGLPPGSNVVPFGVTVTIAEEPISSSMVSSQAKTILVPGTPDPAVAGASPILPVPRYAKQAKLAIKTPDVNTFQLILLANQLGQSMVTSFSSVTRPVNMDAAGMMVPQGALFFQVARTDTGFVAGDTRVVFDLAI